MQQFNCPWCGMRDQSEFTYGREVAPALAASAADWQRFVFERDNPCGAHAEWWHHNHGCRQWLEIVRDTMTHEVLQIQVARPPSGANDAGAAANAAALTGADTLAPGGVPQMKRPPP